MSDFLRFRRMITPTIIQVIFWIGIGVTLLTAFIMLIAGLVQLGDNGFAGLATIFFALVVLAIGPLMLRVYCEILMIVFRIYDSLRSIDTHVSSYASTQSLSNVPPYDHRSPADDPSLAGESRTDAVGGTPDRAPTS